MSFLTDLFEGDIGNLGNDISHAGSSLMSHPSELYETLGGAAALATGGLGLGLLGGDAAGAGAGGLFSGLFGGGDAAVGAGAAGTDALSLAAPDAGSAALTGLPSEITTGASAGASPAGFASTDAELFGGATGVPSAGAPAGGFAPTDAELSGGITGTDAAAPAAGAAPAASPAGGGGFWNTLTNPSQWTLGGLGKAAGVAAAGAGLGMDLLNRDKTDPNQQMLSQQAAQLGRQGQVLMSYLQSGKLPPALQAQLSQAVAADKARIISGYAARGMSTDPNQNSALAQDLNNLQIQSVAAMADAQVQMLNSGLKETGMSTDIYNILTKLDIAQDQQLMQAISSFAAALGGGMGGGQNVKLSLA